MSFHHQQGQPPPSSYSGAYQTGQPLGSNVQRMSSGSQPARQEPLLPSNAGHTSVQRAPSLNTALPGSAPPGSVSAPSSAVPQNAHGFDTPRRTQGMARRPDETFYGDAGQNISQDTPQSTHQPRYASQQDTPVGQAPNIHFQQATPQGSQYPNSSSGNMPDALASSTGRPGPSSAYTAPAIVPTMPQINSQQYAPPSRSAILNSSHSHSRSSPAGFDQKYIPFSGTPTATPSSSSKLFSPQTPTGSSAYSPLGLSDIRPRADSDLNEGLGPNATFEVNPVQTNSNYMAPWATYAYDWCKWPVQNGGGCGKMAVGSYLEDPHNFIQILDTHSTPQENAGSGGSGYGLDFVKVAEATCAYPVTRISWEPPSSQKQSTDLLATSGDHLRLWSLPSSQPSMISNNINRSSTVNSRDPAPQKLLPLALLSNSKTPEHTAPLTSLDWNTLSPKLIITSSIDTTCTIWDIPTLTAKTQLIAHDKEVFDVRFCAGSVDVFVSCGADGSVRMFDLRSLEHSTIIYEPAEKSDKEKVASPGRSSPPKPAHTLTPAPPLLRLAASPHDAHLLATFAADSNLIRILDVRQPGTALLELHGHSAPLNSIEWSPSRRGMLASGADDSLVLVWDLLNAGGGTSANGGAAPAGHSEGQGKGPSASWRCDYEISNVSWAPQSGLTSQGGDWLGVCGGRGIWGVKL